MVGSSIVRIAIKKYNLLTPNRSQLDLFKSISVSNYIKK